MRTVTSWRFEEFDLSIEFVVFDQTFLKIKLDKAVLITNQWKSELIVIICIMTIVLSQRQVA